MKRFLENLPRGIDFWVVFGLPLGLVLIYLFILSTPRYISHSQFYVHTTNSSGGAENIMAGLLTGQGSISKQEALIIREYLLSLDVALEIDEKFNLREKWSDNSVDFLARLKSDAVAANFHALYEKRLSINVRDNGIVELDFEGLDPETTSKVAKYLLSRGEAFINEVSQSLAEDQVAFIVKQVGEAEERLRKNQIRLTDLQNNQEAFSPEAETETILGTIRQLEASLSEVETEISQLRSFLAPDSPRLRTQEARADALREQIRERNARLVGSESSLNERLLEFQAVKIDEQFAERAYASAYASLESARVEAARKLKQLVVIQAPIHPTEPARPRKAYILINAVILLSMAYIAERIVRGIILEHK